MKHLVFDVGGENIDIECTQEECPYWFGEQKNCDSEEILELDQEKLVFLIERLGGKVK